MFAFCYFSIRKDVYVKKERLNITHTNQNTKHKYVYMYDPHIELLYKEIEHAN